MKKLSGRFTPLRIFLIYIATTFVLFLILPVTYYNINLLLLSFFLCFFLFVFIIGYILGIGKNDKKDFGLNLYEHFAIKIIKWFIVISFFLYLWTFFDRLNYFKINLTLDLLINIGATYRNAINAVSYTSLSMQVLTLLSPITTSSLILGMYYYNKLPIKYRFLWLATLIIYLLSIVLFLGTQKYFVDILIYAFSIILIKDIKLRKKMILKILFISTIVLVPLFVYVQYSRLLAYGVYGVNIALTSLMRIDYGSWWFNLFGNDIGIALLLLMLYPSMGYYGLSLSLQMPFKWTYGIGNSLALMSYVSQYFKIDNILGNTYPLRTELATGWPALTYWQTIFPWLASDFTFFGSVIFMGIIAYIYAKAWRELLIYDNPLSVLVFSSITILLLYVPANNQLMQTRDSMISWVFFLIGWLLFHNKLNKNLMNKPQVP